MSFMGKIKSRFEKSRWEEDEYGKLHCKCSAPPYFYMAENYTKVGNWFYDTNCDNCHGKGRPPVDWTTEFYPKEVKLD